MKDAGYRAALFTVGAYRTSYTAAAADEDENMIE